ncbi:MAG: anti-FecI sigma factor, FecR [Chitinophagaceae bacterium]|nr:anti-FecI sigma factor, FecR [Chitinophagaceae bacterium]
MAIPPINKRLQKLARNYLKGKLSASEQQEIDEWFLNEESSESTTEINLSSDQHRRQLLARIHSKAGITQPETRVSRLWVKITVAASVLLMLSVGAYIVLHQKIAKQQTAQNIQDIGPGGNKAILTLANGEKVQLTGAKNGLVAQQGGVAIAKKSDGLLSYSNNQADPSEEKAQLFNTIQTPRGGKYKLVMADGTIAILDAASSIRYPVAFNGKERSVEITGQVYFEVIHNADQPFKVSVKGQIIEDLGTKFNINAYDDEPVIKTTLLEGSIALTRSNHTTILRPGQQAVNTIKEADTKVVVADIEEVVAWKNDYFVFNNEAIESVMRKISRWYDVDIQYKDGQKIKETYLGGLTRYSNVSQVLKMLEITGDVKFEIKGKTIVVFPKVK